MDAEHDVDVTKQKSEIHDLQQKKLPSVDKDFGLEKIGYSSPNQLESYRPSPNRLPHLIDFIQKRQILVKTKHF